MRDAVIDYITAMGTVSPKIEDRLLFADSNEPTITFTVPQAGNTFLHPSFLTLDFNATDAISGVKEINATLDSVTVKTGDVIDLYTLSLGTHTLAVTAVDWYGNEANQSVTFTVTATIPSLIASVDRFYSEGKIKSADVRASLLAQLQGAQAALEKDQVKTAINKLNAFNSLAKAQKGKSITTEAAGLLTTDANWVIADLKTTLLGTAGIDLEEGTKTVYLPFLATR